MVEHRTPINATTLGGATGGTAVKDILNFSQGLASQEYQNAFNRYYAERANKLQPLQSLAGIGQTSANTLSNAAGNYGAQVGANLQAAGAAQVRRGGRNLHQRCLRAVGKPAAHCGQAQADNKSDKEYSLQASKIAHRLNKNEFVDIETLSGGERIRLLIARIIYAVKTKNYNILLFDEIDEVSDPLKSQLNIQDENDDYEDIDNSKATFFKSIT